MDYLLWYQDDKTPLEERLIRAAQHFEKKIGRAPTQCLIPTTESMTAGKIGPICVEARANVLPCHLEIGAA